MMHFAPLRIQRDRSHLSASASAFAAAFAFWSVFLMPVSAFIIDAENCVKGVDR